MAKYKKKRARELKHDKFRDTTMLLADRLADRVAGRGRQILYGFGALVVVALFVFGFVHWRQKHAEEAEAALGRAIAINRAEISLTPLPNSKELVFSTEQERAQRAIEEFRKVEAKYGDPFRTEARYFIATNLLLTDHEKGLSALQSLSQGSGDIALLSKFALAQAREGDGKLDEALALYNAIAQANSPVVTVDTANLRVALIYDKQGKKKEASDLLFNIISKARNTKGKDGKPLPESAAAREAAQRLLKIDPARHAQLPQPPSALDLGI